MPVGRRHAVASDFRHVLAAAVAHYQLELTLHDFEHAIHARLSESAQAPQERAADANCGGAEGERLVNVGPAAKTAIDEYRDAAPDFGHNFGQRFDGGAQSFSGASAMVRNPNAIESVLQREPRVFAPVDPLDQQFHRDEFTQTVYEVPVHRGIRPADAGHVDAFIHGPFARAGRFAGAVAYGALAKILGPHALIGLAVSPGRVIDGKRDHRAARGFDAMNNFFGDGPRRRRVQLIPDRPAVRLAHFFDAGGSRGGKHLQRAASLGGAGHGELAFGME